MVTDDKMELELSKPEYLHSSTSSQGSRRSNLKETQTNGTQNTSKSKENKSLTNSDNLYTGMKTLTTGLRSDSRGSLASTNISLAKTRSLNGSFIDIEMTPARRAKMAEVENNTIQRQRTELQLMIAELKGRDRELNDMVSSHQKQMIAWERDRRQILTLEEKCAMLEKDILMKKDEVRSIAGKLRVAEAKDMDKSAGLNRAQEELASVTEERSRVGMQIDELQEKNRGLTKTVMELNSTIGQFDAREQELLTILKLKDKDLSEASTRIAELSAKNNKLDNQYEQSKRQESELRRTSGDWKNKYNQTWKEYEHIKRELRKSEQKNEAYVTEIGHLKHEFSTVRKEAILACERDKRKESMLELQRSQQERSELELTNMRELYERQQRDIGVLHLNLENTKEIVDKQQTRLLHQRKMEIEAGGPALKYNNALTYKYTRSRSPNSRTPTRSSVRSTVLRSPTSTGSSFNVRSISPDSTRNRTRSPEYRSRSGSYRSNSPTSRSPDRYYSRSPDRARSPAADKQDVSYKEIPYLETSEYYGKSFTSSPSKYGKSYTSSPSKYEPASKLPYNSYSMTTSYNDYNSHHWSSTKALAHSAEEIINKYYPIKDPDDTMKDESHQSRSQQSTPRQYSHGDEGQEVIHLPEVPRSVDEPGGCQGSDDEAVGSGDRPTSLHSHKDDDDLGSHHSDGFPVLDSNFRMSQNGSANQMARFLSADPTKAEPLLDRDDQASAHSASLSQMSDVNGSQQAESVHSHHSRSEPAESIHSLHSVHSRSEPAESVHSLHSVHSRSEPAESIHSLHSVHSRSEPAESIHSLHSVHSTHSKSEPAESIHSVQSVHSNREPTESVHSIHSIHSRSESIHSQPSVHSHHSAVEPTESIHSIHSRSDLGSPKAGSIHSRSDLDSPKAGSVHSIHSSHSIRSDCSGGSVKRMNSGTADTTKSNNQYTEDNEVHDELEDMFSTQPSKISQLRPDSTTPTNDTPAINLLAETNSFEESPRLNTEEIVDVLERPGSVAGSVHSNNGSIHSGSVVGSIHSIHSQAGSLHSIHSQAGSLHSSKASLKDTGKSGNTESLDGMD